jgi:hypothetical protein
MRIVTISLLLVSVAAPSLCSAQTSASAWDVRKFGAVGDGKTDCAQAFQDAVDAAARGVTKTIFIPAGRYLVSRPVFVDAPGVKVIGMGEESNIVITGYHPGFVFGIRRVEKDNKVIDASYRPDVSSVLDKSVAAAGKLSGFATKGRVFLASVAHPAQLGMRTTRSEDRCFDYWGEFKAFTLEVCLEPDPRQPWKAWAPLLGLGSFGVEPAPWALTVADDPQTLKFGFKTSDFPELSNNGDREITIPLSGIRPPYRLRVAIDFEAGKVGAWVNERRVASSVSDQNARGKPWKPGLRFKHTRARHPFLVGKDGATPDLHDGKVTPLRLHGLRVSRVARGKPANDAEAYLGNDSDTVFFLPLTGRPGRMIDLASGKAADGAAGSAILLHGDGSLGGILSNAICDLRISGGAPGILLGGVLRFRMERVRSGEGMVGLGSVPMVVSYPVTIRDCEFSGFDAAVSLWRCEVRATGIDLERGGQTAMRLHGCSADVSDCMVYFNSGVSDTAIDILRGEGWGKYYFRNVNVDNEARGYDSAVIRCESSAYTRPYVDIDGLEASQVGKTGAIIELIDGPIDGGWYPSRIDARHLLCFSQDHGAVLRVDGPNWFGKVDVTLLKGPFLDYRGTAGTSGVKIVTEREQK